MSAVIRVAGSVEESIVDGPGLRYVLFVQGCPHRCPGCHNPETHDFAGGVPVTVERLAAEILANPLTRGVTFSGGEPFCQSEGLTALADLLRPSRHLAAYSGYTLEELLAEPRRVELLRRLDLLVDGPFLRAQASLELRFRGSRNQRILDVPASLKAGKAVALEA